jgi:GntR family transcriptional regulator
MQKKQTGFANTGIPLYYQLENVLREKIASGAFAPGDRLPTESELIKQYGVSRITVRQALGTLAEDGLIERHQGRGTFIAQRRTRKRKFNGITHLTGSLDELIEMGSDVHIKVLEFNLVEADKNEAEIFQVKVGTPVYRLKRLRLYEDKPYSLIVNYLPAEIGSQLTQEELSSGAILKMIETKFGVHLNEAKQQIKAELADPYAAGQLNVRVGSPLLSIERTVFADDGKPVEFGHTLYRSDVHGFSVHLKRENNKTKKNKAVG